MCTYELGTTNVCMFRSGYTCTQALLYVDAWEEPCDVSVDTMTCKISVRTERGCSCACKYVWTCTCVYADGCLSL